MTASRGLRIAVVGATGAVGTEVLTAIDASSLRIAQLVAVAGQESLDTDIEFQDEIVPVHDELPALLGLDGVLCCAPLEVAPDVVRAALRAEVPCLDLSGAFASRDDVPLYWAPAGGDLGAPLLAAPPSTALVWLPLLRSLAELAPVLSVSGVVMEAASASGRRGIEALSAESMALFNQQEIPEGGVLGHPLAFDCHPTSGERDEGEADLPGRTRERELAAALGRLLDSAPHVSARWIQVPAFVGQMSNLVLRFERPVDTLLAAEALAKVPGVELWDREGEGPNLRAAAGQNAVIVSAPERDAAGSEFLQCWAAADVLRLAALNSVAFAAARFDASAQARPGAPH